MTSACFCIQKTFLEKSKIFWAHPKAEIRAKEFNMSARAETKSAFWSSTGGRLTKTVLKAGNRYQYQCILARCEQWNIEVPPGTSKFPLVRHIWKNIGGWAPQKLGDCLVQGAVDCATPENLAISVGRPMTASDNDWLSAPCISNCMCMCQQASLWVGAWVAHIGHSKQTFVGSRSAPIAVIYCTYVHHIQHR